MMQWMLGDWELFGIMGQNWMLALAGIMLAYVLALLAWTGRTPRL